MSASSKRAGGPPRVDAEVVLLWTAIVLVAVAVGLVTAAVHLGAALDDDSQRLPANPFALTFGLADGSVRWPHAATAVLVVLLVLLAAVAVAVATVGLRRRARRSRVDRAGRQMGRGRELAALRRRGAGQTAARLNVQAPGLPIAQTVVGGDVLYASWEDCAVDIWGPRTGKTTSRAIPTILEAPGAVVVTSNKRDIVDATRGPRASKGQTVWVFDPQQLVNEPDDCWWWNPLSYVTDEVKAWKLADVFATASRDQHATVNSYFDNEGRYLVGGLLLAAAKAERPLTQVSDWLGNSSDDEPVGILRRHGYEQIAVRLQSVLDYASEQRSGVYGTAGEIAKFMGNTQAMRWALPAADDRRREFDPNEFVKSTETLYSLSREGLGSAAPLVTALTVAVTEAAEEHAKRCAGGRLAVPMVAVLDEAANVCRWRELPSLYSHYGSRGICLLTILQSWSQGVEVWGRDGMRKLWSAANIKVYGGGVSEVEFLSELSQLIGDFNLDTISISRGKGGRSTNHATRQERKMSVADLAALPKGRAVLLASGAPPVLVRTTPWMTGPHAAAVQASIRTHDPAAQDTLTRTVEQLPETTAADATMGLPA